MDQPKKKLTKKFIEEQIQQIQIVIHQNEGAKNVLLVMLKEGLYMEEEPEKEENK